MSESRLRKRYMDCSGLSMEEAEAFGRELAQMQRDINFWCGDLARYAEARWPDTHQQVWPEWVSPGMLARNGAVARAYPKEEDRQHEATYTQYMQNTNRPDRQERLAAIVDKGQTSDESRKANQEERAADNKPRWLLVVDVHYHLHRHWFSGAGVEAAVRVAEWVQRTVARLKEKGLTDVVCAFEGRDNFRKKLTEGEEWEEQRYKDRPPKDQELVQQLILVRELLEGHGYCCVSLDGYEADDIMASYAKQFPGHITLLSADKDVRQCLSEKCNILLDVEWEEDPQSGDMLPDYKWLTAAQNTEKTGLRPDQWADYQTIMGDTVDGVKGIQGIGEKGAADLVKEYGSVEAVIQAAKDEDERIKPKKRETIIEFEPRLEVTRQLVTLRTDLNVPPNTRIT